MNQIRRLFLHRFVTHSHSLLCRELSTFIDGASTEWAPYRAVQGVNLPYPKVPRTMESYIFRNKSTPEQVEAALFEIWDKLTIRELEAAFYSLKRMDGYPSTSLLQKLSKKTIEHSEEITCRHVASIFLATSRLKYFDADLFDQLATEALKDEKLRTIRGYFCGIIIYSLAVLHRYFLRTIPVERHNEIYFPLQIKLISALVDRMVLLRDEVGQTNQNLGNLVYGLGILEFRNDPLLTNIAAEAAKQERVETFNEREISNMVYGFGLLKFKPEFLLIKFCKLLSGVGGVRSWSEQALSNLVYGFGCMQFHPPEALVCEILEEVCDEQRLQRFYNQHLLNLTQGLARIGIRSFRVFDLLLDELVSRRKRFELMLNGLANVIYCLTRIEIYHEHMKVFLEDLTSDRYLPRLSDQAISNLLSAFGESLPDDMDLFPFLEKIIKEAIRSQRLSRFNEVHYAQILTGLSRSQFTSKLDPVLLNHLIEGATVPGLLRSYSNAGLERLVCLLLKLHYHDEEGHDRICKEVCRRNGSIETNTLATLIHSWSLMSYRNQTFMQQVEKLLNQNGVIENCSESVLREFVLGLVILDSQNTEALQKILVKMREADQLDQLIQNIHPEILTKFLNFTWLDCQFRNHLELKLESNV
eukprot:g3080.t1